MEYKLRISNGMFCEGSSVEELCDDLQAHCSSHCQIYSNGLIFGENADGELTFGVWASLADHLSLEDRKQAFREIKDRLDGWIEMLRFHF